MRSRPNAHSVSLVLLLEDHSGVDDLQALALLVDEDRVGVGLSDFVAELADELRDSGDGLGEDLLVADLLATSAVEHREALDLLHHLVGGVLVERSDTESDVLEDFDEDAALTEEKREQRCRFATKTNRNLPTPNNNAKASNG